MNEKQKNSSRKIQVDKNDSKQAALEKRSLLVPIADEKQAHSLNPPQSQIPSFPEAKREAIALPSHLEQEITDSKEQDLLKQFSAYITGANDSAVQSAYEALIKAVASTSSPLSPAARLRFANLCYSYWAKVLLSQTEFAQLQMEHQKNLQSFAEQAQENQILFRSAEQPTRYYWAYAKPRSNADNARKGLFLRCYPHFEQGRMGQSEGTKIIYVFTEITEATAVQQCEALLRYHQQRKRQQQLWADINILCQAFKQQNVERFIVHLQITQLCLQKGYLGQDCFAAFQTDNAVYFLKPTLNTYSDQAWTDTVTLPSSLITAVKSLRDAVDEALVYQAQTQLAEIRFKTLQHEVEDLLENPACPFSFQAFYLLMQKAFNAANIFVRFPALYQPVLAYLVQQLAQDKNPLDIIRKELDTGVEVACDPRQQPEDQLLSLTAQVVELAVKLQPHDERRAITLLQWYQDRLILQLEKLDKQFKKAPSNTYYKNSLSHCQTAIAQCQILPASPLSQPSALPQSTPISAFAAREIKLMKWHKQIAEALEQKKSISTIQTFNTTFAKGWFAELCQEVEQQLGEPPCAFVFTGSGSLSRGEVSACSDIDFQLLVADSSSQNQTYFHAFLRLLTWKAAAMPSEVLKIESNTLGWITSKQWWGTPQELIDRHLYLPIGEHQNRTQQPENFNVQWLTSLYVSQIKQVESQALFQQYQDKLTAFFQPQNIIAPYPYQQHAPWSLQQHLQYQKKQQDKGESKSELKGVASPAERPVEIAKTVHLKLALLYPLTNALLCYARFTGVTGVTDSQQLIAHLTQKRFLPPAFLKRLTEALTDLHCWRFTLHWAQLHHPHSSELQEDEVFIWPDDATRQQTLQRLPHSLCLNASETQRLAEIETTILQVISKSLTAFMTTIPAQPTQPEDKKSSARVVSSSRNNVSLSSTPKHFENSNPTSSISSPSSVSQFFNPVVAALDATISALHARARVVEGMFVASVEDYEDLEWIAHIVNYYTEALPLPQILSQREMPDILKSQAPLVQQHWSICQRLPGYLRNHYLDALQSTSKPRRTPLTFSLPGLPVVCETAYFQALPELGRPVGSYQDIQFFRANVDQPLWIGKCGARAILIQQPTPASTSTSNLYEHHFDEYKEWLGLVLYRLIGVDTGEICLSKQLCVPSSDGPLPGADYQNPVLHLMVQSYAELYGNNFIERYLQHASAHTDYYHVTTRSGMTIPLQGFGALLAASCFLYDLDCVGPKGKKVSYVIETDSNGRTIAKTRKHDAQWVFKFLDSDYEPASRHDPRSRTIHWGKQQKHTLTFEQMTSPDQAEFIATLYKLLQIPAATLRTIIEYATVQETPDSLSRTQAEHLLTELLARRSQMLEAYFPELIAYASANKLQTPPVRRKGEEKMEHKIEVPTLNTSPKVGAPTTDPRFFSAASSRTTSQIEAFLVNEPAPFSSSQPNVLLSRPSIMPSEDSKSVSLSATHFASGSSKHSSSSISTGHPSFFSLTGHGMASPTSVETSDKSTSSTSSMQASLSDAKNSHRNHDATLLEEVQNLVDQVYPPRDVEHADTRKAYLLQLAEFQRRQNNVGPVDRLALERLRTELQWQQIMTSGIK